MVKTIGLERAAKKWIERARVAGPEYEAGVKAPKTPWAAAAVAAKPTYKSAVTAIDTPELYERGVKRAGDARWSDMAIKKGVSRFAPGVELSDPYYRAQMSEIIGKLEAITLPGRKPRGDIGNLERVGTIFRELHAWRLAKRAAA